MVLFLAFLCAPALKAQDGLSGVLSRRARTAQEFPQLSPEIAAADFDNDQKPDGAILVETGLLNGLRAFRIELHFTAGNNNSITFSSDESGLAISALDVNRDGAPDIVVERAFTRQRVQVYLNDGHGTFHRARSEDYPSSDPSAPGCRTKLTQGSPVFCLPGSRLSDTETPQQISVLHRDPSGRFRFWLEGFLVRSAARAPSSSRAPPFPLSL